MLNIRTATTNDIPEILKLIRELAEMKPGRHGPREELEDFRSNMQDLL